MPPLLLPPPTIRECFVCGITSHYMGATQEHGEDMGLYFVEHSYMNGPEREFYNLCDLCEDERRKDDIRAKISISRGVPEWLAEEDAFFGFADMPVICVTQDVEASWKECKPHSSEVWLFCRNRAEWYSAWQIARTIARDGSWPLDRAPISFFLPSHKPAGADYLTVASMRLNHYAPDAGPLIGICDSCAKAGTIVKARGSSQWMECQDCHVADSAPVGEEDR